MATFDNSTLGTIAASESSLTFAHAVAAGSNRILLVFVGKEGTATVTGVTYNGVAMTLIDPPGTIDENTLTGLEVYRLVAPATGTNNVVVTMSTNIGGLDRVTAVAASFTGVDQTNPIAGQASNAASALNNPFTTSVTTTFNNQTMVDMLWYSTGTATTDASQTEMETQDSGPLTRASYKVAATAGSNAMTYATNSASADVCHIVVALTNPHFTSSSTDSMTLTDTLASLIRARLFSVLNTVTATDSIVATVAEALWRNVSKNAATFVNAAKNNATFQNVAKNVSSWLNTPKT